jgi:flavin-dependent dehydrogenase
MRHLLRRFLEREGFKPLAYQGARIALYEPFLKVSARVGEATVLLVGDAAGHVKVTTVGGSVSGLLGAAAAARALIHHRRYQTELRAVTRELALHWGMRAALDRFDNQAYNRLVACVSPRVRTFLSLHNRDEMAEVAWQLPILQPRLLALAPHVLFRTLRRRPQKAPVPASAQE